MACLQYYYESPEDRKNNRIPCNEKYFPNFDNPEVFNNKNLLEFVQKNFGKEAFPDAGVSPLEFQPEYINKEYNQLCNPTSFNLTPQQKFCGQFFNPLTNFRSGLIYHGLGSGKTCTSLVIGEAFKNARPGQRILYVVPAPLVDQYYEEIIGRFSPQGDLNSCTYQCMVFKGESDDEYTRSMYINADENSILQQIKQEYSDELQKLEEIRKKAIEKGEEEPKNTKEYKKQLNIVEHAKSNMDLQINKVSGKVAITFEILSHNVFINMLFRTIEGELTKGDIFPGVQRRRFNQGQGVFEKGGILIIDEIQRLVSAGGILYKKLYTAIKYYFHPELRIILMSATPVYDNPYELALTMNLLQPRIPFPTKKEDFYKFFMGEDTDEGCVKSKDAWVKENSCIINHEMLRYLCSGYVSYFKGGNPIVYPYKRIITMEHIMKRGQLDEYIKALRSDIKNDKNFEKKGIINDEILFGDINSVNDDSISGIYVNTQQYSNIAFPTTETLNISKETSEIRKNRIESFKDELKRKKLSGPEQVIEYINEKGYSTKLAKIIELSIRSTGPVFIFSNWLQYGVQALSVILEACGYVKFPLQGEKRYFIWSSETKSLRNADEIINSARSTFNSPENADGSLLKIILGTRSVMEGVSFKNVKEVHITDPWWNEARIQQILARAVRFCSHSFLPPEQRYVDIYRHYSSLPIEYTPDGEMIPNESVMEMLESEGLKEGFKDFEIYGVDKKMSFVASKKELINSEFEQILKEVSIDCELNKNGNLIRLEENLIPMRNGNYQLYFKNTSNMRIYIRKGIPEEGITFDQLYNRDYSFPNAGNLPLEFIESDSNFIPYPDAEILNSSSINTELILYEKIDCWKSGKTFQDIQDDPELYNYLDRLYKNYRLLPAIRQKYFGEQVLGSKIAFNIDTDREYNTAIQCLNSIHSNESTPVDIKKQIRAKFSSKESKKQIEQQINDLVYKYNAFSESYIEQLYELAFVDPRAISDLIKTFTVVEKKKSKK